MSEEQAKTIAEALGGTAWNSGGDVYLVRVERTDGHLVVLSDEVICEYDGDEAFEENRARSSILLH